MPFSLFSCYCYVNERSVTVTKNDIIKAAFRVWGRELYINTSLSQISGELGVSKAALYRHFKNKDALLEAMFSSYFDDFASFIKNAYDKAVSLGTEDAANRCEGGLIMMRTIAEYYLRNRDTFVFSFIRVFNSRDKENMIYEFRMRGIDFERLVERESAGALFPSNTHLTLTTLIFYTAEFHRVNKKTGEAPSDKLIKDTLAEMENRIIKGLSLNPEKVLAIDYRALEQQAAGKQYEDTETNALLRAVAQAVAEAGPWEASMEMVARRSGLSKSGLYAHFKNKQDMVRQLFMTEFTRMINYAKLQIETTEDAEKQLYLVIISIADYLRSRPEILVAMEWIKTRRLELGEGALKQLRKTIADIKTEVILRQDRNQLVQIAQWILFMVVNTMAWYPRTEGSLTEGSLTGSSLINKTPELPNESLRLLFKFIALGLEGLKREE